MTEPRYWTADKVAELHKMILSGATSAEICEHFNKSHDAIKQIRHRYNLPLIRKWPDSRIKQLTELRQSGWMRKQLAEFYGVSVSTITRVVHDRAVPRRRYNRFTRKQIQSIRNLSELGFGNHFIGRELNRSAEQIRKALAYYSKRGWPM